MPSVEAAALVFSGTLRTSRVAPARLYYTANPSLIRGSETPVTPEAATPDLDNWTRYDRPQAITEMEWTRWMARDQSVTDAIEAAFRAVNARIDEVAILARLNTVEVLAQTANDNASRAQVTATTAATAAQQTFVEIDPVYGDTFQENYKSGIPQ